MNETQVSYLMSCLAAGLTIWFKDMDGFYLRILQIVEEYPEQEETGACAFLEGGRGEYLALDNTDTADIMITTGNLAKWP